MTNKLPDKNLTMPIDQYGRYGLVAKAIKQLMERQKQKKVKILDVGGYKGEIHKFFTQAEATITVIDLFDSTEKNYVKGSALAMPFREKEFDYVVSFEVFEHIPRRDRIQFITEMLRVSKGTIILTAPFSGEHNEVLESEKNVNELWKLMHGENHRWLYEHITYKTPKTTELEKILNKKGLQYQKFGNNELTLWNLMLSFNYLSTLFDMSGLNPEIQEFYNLNAEVLEYGASHYYRYMYVIGKGANLVKIERTEAASPVKRVKATNNLINHVFMKIAANIQAERARRQKEIDRLAKQLEERIALYDNLVNELESIQLRNKRGGKIRSIISHKK